MSVPSMSRKVAADDTKYCPAAGKVCVIVRKAEPVPPPTVHAVDAQHVGRGRQDAPGECQHDRGDLAHDASMARKMLPLRGRPPLTTSALQARNAMGRR
jgi:hypothetical protein